MSDKFTVGQIIEGKVTGVQPYGVFVALNDEIQGLVHISEVTHGYVKDINEFLSVGDEVKAKILSIDEENKKYSLSIRATQDAPQQTENKPKQQPKKQAVAQQGNPEPGFNTLKDKLTDWIKQSEERENTFKK
ncbi:S1 domain-containing post-transcriptional regulator GSP13 [Aquibacillus koreensis]|uniref:S1 domain-containing post-transcriptional regulator GSP13 n=1 Tax=Aquibacillus koreensis TaxID=279446 RepID=A0A9X3WIC7_9BACI|nr:S1 domain-containing post-transcriptional regulator GSP13 [Aquibacillus koreensis]MCT2535861.1 S1 domain-containing post-transcriptional regulator GSP13 [Aquibacillus koreensis]MDC3420317.1 S1 domain-containing post-transcriptional regulator GSP13 [Aquibacillus koreensis]